MKKFLAIALVALLTACGGGGSMPSPTPPPPAPVTWSVTNGTVTVTANANYGAAVTSVVDAHGQQYVDVNDHGREFQTAYQLDGLGEGYNPTEAGSAADNAKASTSTIIESVSFPAPNVITTTVHPAYWQPYQTAIVSPDTITKTVTVGWKGLSNVLRWDVAITLASDHSTWGVEGLTGYGPEFSNLYVQGSDGFSFDPAPLTSGTGYTSAIIATTADGSQAVGAYSPGFVYWYQDIPGAHVGKWDCAWFAETNPKAGEHTATCYVAVGTLAEVKASIAALETSSP